MCAGRDAGDNISWKICHYLLHRTNDDGRPSTKIEMMMTMAMTATMTMPIVVRTLEKEDLVPNGWML